MSDPVQTYSAPKNLLCPRCKTVIETLADTTPDSSNAFRKGKIIVCGNCALINIVGDSSLIPMTMAQVKALPAPIQAMLWKTVKPIADKVKQDKAANN